MPDTATFQSLSQFDLPPAITTDADFVGAWQAHILPTLREPEVHFIGAQGWVSCAQLIGPVPLLTSRRAYPLGWRYDIPVRVPLMPDVQPQTPSSHHPLSFDWARFHWVPETITPDIPIHSRFHPDTPLTNTLTNTLASPDSIPEALQQALTTQACHYRTVDNNPYPQIALHPDDTWDSYWASRSKKTRERLNNRTNRAKGLGVCIEPIPQHLQNEAIQQLLNWHAHKLQALHQHPWRQPGPPYLFDLPEEQAFFWAWVDALQRQERLIVMGVYLNNTLCGVLLTIVTQPPTLKTAGSIYCLITATSGDYPEASPGSLALLGLTQWCIENHYRFIDMGLGITDIKRSLATHILPTSFGWLVSQSSWLGQLTWLQSQWRLGKPPQSPSP